ncbi:hypothetical protein MKJ01_18550 [Chryseobacterium sp. SSA4.19]|uniref:hypothetical protein n=1 Tax=Chryseobacterium sp. SSA4.19 TaxID=2919915 RepID=UPI001F4DDA27|nr:hypothetical protein [Chryseobacterium sp. SSA4.19]MCJ8155759.1 hypothetical protein [Chryseobacterium sp. SSA4.19]
MKILKKEKLNIHLKNNLWLIFCLLSPSLVLSQKLNDYYLTTNIVTFKNPVLVVPDYSKVGIFIMESEDFEKEKNIKKLFKLNKAFLFDTESFSFHSISDRKKLNIIEKDYDYNSRKEEGKTIILKLDEKMKSFYIGFIKLSYYNRVDASAHARYPYIQNTDNYEPVFIPSFTE